MELKDQVFCWGINHILQKLRKSAFPRKYQIGLKLKILMKLYDKIILTFKTKLTRKVIFLVTDHFLAFGFARVSINFTVLTTNGFFFVGTWTRRWKRLFLGITWFMKANQKHRQGKKDHDELATNLRCN